MDSTAHISNLSIIGSKTQNETSNHASIQPFFPWRQTLSIQHANLCNVMSYFSGLGVFKKGLKPWNWQEVAVFIFIHYFILTKILKKWNEGDQTIWTTLIFMHGLFCHKKIFQTTIILIIFSFETCFVYGFIKHRGIFLDEPIFIR
jgi:hypothetical protein